MKPDGLGRTAIIEVTKHSVLNHILQIVPIIPLRDNCETLSDSEVTALLGFVCFEDYLAWSHFIFSEECIRQLQRIIVHKDPCCRG